jgi:DNA-binding LytR/AlgR family response regulator
LFRNAMSLSDGRNKPVPAGSVESARDHRSIVGDGHPDDVTSGGWRGTGRLLLSRYGWLALLILATAIVNVLTAAQHGIGLPGLVRSMLDEATSALVLIALLPILRGAMDAFAVARDRRIALIIAALAIVTYAALHVVLTVLLREIAYPPLGQFFEFHWREQALSEFRKDLISAFMITVVFWLIGRRSAVSAPDVAQFGRETLNREIDARSEKIWLKDGTTSVRVDPAEIISVTSAGNYVEFELRDRKHLVRGTLAAEESRLKPFGFCRVHRTKLVNTGRIAAIEQRPNGDFALRIDTGAMIIGSRRYRGALAAIKGAGQAKE